MSRPAEKIKIRKINFGHEKVQKKYYGNGNPIFTHFLNSLHSVFPEGEKLFIRSVSRFEKEITGPELKERVNHFIGQEMQHYTQHMKYWKTLDSWGLQADGFTKWYAEHAYVKTEGLLKGIGQKLFGPAIGDRMSLSVTAALEHYTASIAEVVLQDAVEIFKGLPEDMQQFFKWHAAEEIEHKAVAFDVFTDVIKGTYAERMSGFAIGTYGLTLYILAGWIWYLLKDEKINAITFVQSIPYAAKTLYKITSNVTFKALYYLKPDFHPQDMQNDHLADNFFKNNTSYIAAKTG